MDYTSTYDYGTTTTADPAAIAGLMGMMGILIIPLLIVAAVMLVSMWKLFVKAGKPGWAAIVPFYNYYVLVQIVGRPMWFFWVYVGCFVASYIPVLNFISWIPLLVLSIILAIDTAKVFGKSGGFAALLILVPVVGYPMLAFGDAQYQGPAQGAARVDTMPPTPPVEPTPPATPQV